MGADLYGKLTKYLVQHLKLVKDVGGVHYYASCHLTRCYRAQTTSWMRSSYDTTQKNGIGIQLAPTTSTVSSRISIDTG